MKKFAIIIIILFIITAILIIAFSLRLGSGVGGDNDDENDDSMDIQHITYFWLYIYFLLSMFSFIAIFLINDKRDFLNQAIFKIGKY